MDRIIRSGELEVELRLPGEDRWGSRFSRMAVARQVTLRGEHSFCVPEQVISTRATCDGVGLCGEYVWPGLAGEAAPGAWFPKLGVGLLRQRAEGGDYDIFHQYEVEPFETAAEVREDRAIFVQQPKECMGVAALIRQELRAYQNTLTLSTMIENHGERPLCLGEYQHNFLALSGLPVGPGYALRLPFDGAIGRADGCAFPLGKLPPVFEEGYLHAQGQTILWDRALSEYNFWKGTGEGEILPMAGYEWTLTHQSSPARVSERMSFVPQRLVLWGAEHCVCPEVYAPIDILPGGRSAYSRQWIFEAD